MARKSTVVAVANLEVGKSGYALASKRTDAEWDVLFASTILPALRNGATMQSQRSQFGPSEKIRQAARRAGYASIADAKRGEDTFTPIKVKGVRPAIVAKRINDARTAGDSWNHLRLRTGMERDDMSALLKAHGFDAVVTGRVLTSERSKAKAAKAAALEAAKAAKPRRTRKAKVTA